MEKQPSKAEQTKEALYRRRSYSFIDQKLTKREEESGVFRCPEVRGLILSIGQKAK